MSVRTRGGIAKVFAAAALAGTILLPFGIVPRVMQGQELDRAQEHIIHAVPAVSIARPEPAPPARSIQLPGTVEAIEQTPIFARANGFIKQRLADIGDRVNGGQVLARIETPEINDALREAQAQVIQSVAQRAQIEADVESARAALQRTIAELSQMNANLAQSQSEEKLANSTYQRYKKLVDQGAVSAQDGDERETRMMTAKAATQAAQDRIRALQSEVVAAKARVKAQLANLAVNASNTEAARARVARLQTELGFQDVVAPFDGVITERGIDEGSLVSSGSDSSKQPLYRVARMDTVKVFVEVPQFASSKISVGQDVSVGLKELPGQKFGGKIARTSVALDTTARTMRAEVHVPNRAGLLAPGMYTEVSFDVPRATRTFLVPSNTVRMTSPDVARIAVVRNGVVSFAEVRTGDDLGTSIEILSGLRGDEQIVLNPSDTLNSGAAVKIASAK